MAALESGSRAPDFELKTARGDIVELSDFLEEGGREVLLRIRPDGKCLNAWNVLRWRIQNFNIILAVFYVTFSTNHSIQ